MARPFTRAILQFAIAFFVCFSAPSIFAAKHSSSGPISDERIDERKQACYADIENGLWGAQCRSSMTEKENCALKCLSSVCFDLIYESDPLEEGERNHVRSQEYRSSVGLNLDQVKGVFDNNVFLRSAASSVTGSMWIIK
ncbi:hypothetical protein HPP92_025661 [Vanilla planifolia]|uniref:Uncharacterized protein n=1 Tax=Vanilla planifolia TaxID=51239 RepID=A0A835UAE5_VANPL|nr:hypothetical protein HPP92_025661 [Vanilla planifolia]